ncbi:GntR family transcriptional regulator [Bordetella petrii]|uniref:GntR family transcriptional regulator n=1 Tax=Bordetella petrii TaxID=94624 RepID=UPI001E52FE78|nr:GntR family transcriptional regulator [Bordetella petrii]MCD0503379.1 GntR family transcriptional regulator [Bordetella petrii]
MPAAPSRALPLYAQLEHALGADIASGALLPDERLPSEDELAARFGVSRITVRTAVQNLVGRGLLEIRRGRGTYVAQPKMRQELTELSGFVEDMQALGRTPTARLLDKRVVPADKDVARHLGLAVGTRVYRIERVRLADGVPVSFDETWLPFDIGRKVVRHNLEAEPIFALLEQKYGLPLLEAEYQLEATACNAHVAQGLAVAPGSPVFLIERTSYSLDNRPVDFERLYYRGDLIRFVTRLARRPRGKPASGAAR